MMEHKEIEVLIQKKLDGEITPEEETKLHEHINLCGECKDYYLGMVWLQEELLGLTEYFPKTDFNERVLSKVIERRKSLVTRLVPLFWFAYLAGSLLLLLTPIINYLFSKFIFLISDALKVFDKFKVLLQGMESLSLTTLKTNQTGIFMAILCALLFFYAFGRIQNRVKEV